jgi:hypothetical protein
MSKSEVELARWRIAAVSLFPPPKSLMPKLQQTSDTVVTDCNLAKSVGDLLFC